LTENGRQSLKESLSASVQSVSQQQFTSQAAPVKSQAQGPMSEKQHHNIQNNKLHTLFCTIIIISTNYQVYK